MIGDTSIYQAVCTNIICTQYLGIEHFIFRIESLIFGVMLTITAKRNKNKPKNIVILFSAKINHKSVHDFHYCTRFISATLYEICNEVCHGLIKFKSITIVLRIILKVFQCQV